MTGHCHCRSQQERAAAIYLEQQGMTTAFPAEAPMPEPGTYSYPAGGLFIDDYSDLPSPTTDLERA